jgi:site-specific DNA recombinase
MESKIRFAPLIRVSTEKQEKKGESLSTQKKQIIDFVERQDGVIPEQCWQYSGQEHATTDQERKKLDKLLSDSSRNVFDAIIVTDASRWSRDNRKSEEGIDILKQNGILFYTGMTEIDLFNPENVLLLKMSVVFNEYSANIQTSKSLLNRIERAKKGIPTGGKPPYGRVFNKQTLKWSIDPEKKQKIEYAADRYLNGESLAKIAETFGISYPTLLKILTKRSGPDWEIRFRSKRLKIDETVNLRVPRLLPQKTIDAILERVHANKTYTHGEIKNKYLLSRMIFCEHCGYAMYGKTTSSGKRYYIHRKDKKYDKCVKFHIPADDIEKAVLIHLFGMFGDVANLEKAMERAIPNTEKLEKMDKQHKHLKRELIEIKKSKKRIYRFIATKKREDEEAAEALADLSGQETHIFKEIERLEAVLSSVPSIKSRKRKAHLWKRQMESTYKSSSKISKMSYDDKKALFQNAFSGKDDKGNRLGVYVSQVLRNKKEQIRYDIKGILGEDHSWLPLTLAEISAVFGYEDDGSYYDPFKDKHEKENKVLSTKRSQSKRMDKLNKLSSGGDLTPMRIYCFQYCLLEFPQILGSMVEQRD